MSRTNIVAAQPESAGAAVEMMPKPAPVPGCPPGLEYLTQIDQLIFAQKVDLAEVLLGWEVANTFMISNSMGQPIYIAQEESTCAQRQFCGDQREFTYHIMDNDRKEVIQIYKEFRCCSGCGWCGNSDKCSWVVEVKSPITGEVLGYVKQGMYCWKVKLHLLDANKDTFATLDGPCCICKCPSACCGDNGDVHFPISGPDGNVIANLDKQWAGCCKEMYTKANNFGVSFPTAMDAKMKAVIMGAVFMLDMMLYEESDNDHSWAG